MAIELSRRLFTVHDYHRMVDAGILSEDDYDEPQPDIFLLRPREDCYSGGHPGARDIFLIVKMADSSLDLDQSVKQELYASAGVQEYWIADIPNDCVRTFADPEGGIYRTIGEFRRGETRAPRLLEDCPIPAASLLP
jgi:Uma2 family endonuclease